MHRLDLWFHLTSETFPSPVHHTDQDEFSSGGLEPPLVYGPVASALLGPVSSCIAAVVADGLTVENHPHGPLSLGP